MKTVENQTAFPVPAETTNLDCIGLMKGAICNSCGDHNGDRKGEVWVECCGRCNELHFIGICNWCQGTGFEVENPETNFKMINDRCEEMNGYLCGYDPRSY